MSGAPAADQGGAGWEVTPLDLCRNFCIGIVHAAESNQKAELLYSPGAIRSFAQLDAEWPEAFSSLMTKLPYEWKGELLRRMREHVRASKVAQPANEPAHAEGAQRFAFATVDELMTRPALPWLMRGVIPRMGLGVVWGASGAAKTFTVTDLAAAIARGIPWAGRRTKVGGVAYVAAEGSLRGRLEAYMAHHELVADDLSLLRVLDSSVNLLDPAADVESLIYALRDLDFGEHDLALVVVDTLNRVMPGGDENSPQDMGMVIANAKRIERDLGCAVVFVHHSGKDETKGSRGHSSLKAAADFEVSVRRDGDVRTVTAEKVRDGADGEVLMTFRLRPVDLGEMLEFDPDADHGERRTSCVVEPFEADQRPKVRPEPRGKNQGVVLKTIRELMVDRWEALPASSAIPVGTVGVLVETVVAHAEPRIVTTERWRAAGRVQEALAGLQAGGWIGVHHPFVWLIQ